jgi:hypothetical protein
MTHQLSHPLTLYRQYALECRAMAARESDPTYRVDLESWAAAWDRVANDVQASLGATLRQRDVGSYRQLEQAIYEFM